MSGSFHPKIKEKEKHFDKKRSFRTSTLWFVALCLVFIFLNSDSHNPIIVIIAVILLMEL